MGRQPTLCLLDEGENCSMCGDIVNGDWEVRHSLSGRCGVRACTACWKNWTVDKHCDTGHVHCICGKAEVSLCTVQSILPAPDFALLAERSSLKTFRRMPNMMTCPMADCTYGHIHDVIEDGLEWTCFVCGTFACASCRAPWHADETCEQYMTRSTLDSAEVKIVDDGEERAIVQCPSCQVMIQKADGCNHMTCPCGAEFCYTCRAPYLWTRTKGWEHVLATKHKENHDCYDEKLKGYELRGEDWEVLRDERIHVQFIAKHFDTVIDYVSDGDTVVASSEFGWLTIEWSK